jgi:phosphoglycolate phosphatase-like HAD superfamily hydrolase
MALLLIDIDGTMIGGEVSSYGDSLEEAIRRVYHKETSVDLREFHGFTDKLVLKETLRRYDISYDEKSLNECLRLFGELFPDNPQGLIVLPGVLETVPKLWESHRLGLVTGNVEVMARKKLGLFHTKDMSLSDYFLFGAFGGTDPHKSRADLIDLAIYRATEDYGWRGKNKHTFVIDDSKRGLEAAIKARVVPIGITTGIYSRTELEETGTKNIVDNFTELPELIERLCDEYS